MTKPMTQERIRGLRITFRKDSAVHECLDEIERLGKDNDRIRSALKRFMLPVPEDWSEDEHLLVCNMNPILKAYQCPYCDKYWEAYKAMQPHEPAGQ